MKKAICVLLLLLLAGCRNLSTNVPTAPAATVSMSPTADPTGEGDAHAAEYAFSFTAQTLDGAEMTEAAFSEHDLTMVNVWASWCPPCRGELPELAALYGRLPENVGFLSVTVDDPGDLPDAKTLLGQNGCAFPCLDGQGSEGLMKTCWAGSWPSPPRYSSTARGTRWAIGSWAYPRAKARCRTPILLKYRPVLTC